MASINGVTIKNLKSFRDHEECPIFQGDIWIDGKNGGFWTQHMFNGADIFASTSTNLEIEKRAQQFSDGYPKSAPFAEYQSSPDNFMDELVKLILDEKAYKKCVKKGFKTSIFATDGYHLAVRGVKQSPEVVAKDADSIKKEMTKGFFKNTEYYFYMHGDADSFNIICDAEHTAPERFIPYYDGTTE